MKRLTTLGPYTAQEDIVFISDGDDDDDDDGIAFVGMTQSVVPALAGPSRHPMLISSDSEDDPQDIFQLLQTDGGRVSNTGILDRKGKARAVQRITIDVEANVSVECNQTRAITTTRYESNIAIEQPTLIDTPSAPATVPAAKPIKVKRKSTNQLGEPEKKSKKTERSVEPVSMSKEEREAIKTKEKAEKQLQRDMAKTDKEAQKSYAKKLAEVNKLRISKNDTVREIHLYLSPDLFLPSSPIAGALPEIQTRVKDNLSEIHELADCSIPGVIKFKRHLKARWDPAQKLFIPLNEPRWVWESTILLVVTAEDIVDKIAVGEDDLVLWASDIRLALNLSPNDQLMMMVKGLQKYNSKTKSVANKEFTAAARAALGGAGATTSTVRTRVSQEHIEIELVKLQVAQRCFIVHVEKTEDIEDWVYNIAADVALRPYKLISKSHLNFCPTDGIRKGGNPTDTFELMLQEVQGITPSAAVGIASEYPTFRDLMQAFEAAEKRGDGKAETMLQDCEIKTLRDGTANGRKLNKALAKRVYNVFRGDDSLALA